MVAALHSYTHPTWLRFWGTGSFVESNDVIMSWLRLTATSNCFPHVRHTKSVWAHCYAIHGHSVSALHSYSHLTWLRFWGSGSLLESTWCDYVMVKADSHLKLLPSSMLDIYKVFEHIASAVYGHSVSALHSYTHPTWLRFWGFGSLVDSTWCEYVMVEADSHLKLLPTSIFDLYKVIDHIDILSIGIW